MELPDGLYEGVQKFDDGAVSFQFRFDRESRPDGLTPGLVSGELFDGPEIDPAAFRRFFFSREIAPDGDGLRIDMWVFGPRLPGQSGESSPLADAVLTCRPSGPEAFAATLDLSTPTNGVFARFAFTLTRRPGVESSFRVVDCQVHFAGDAGLRDAVADAFDKVRQDFRNARVLLRGGVATDPAHLSVWDEGNLLGVMTGSSGFFTGADPAKMAWRVFLMVAPAFRDAGVAGIMFDQFDSAPRQGAAAFWAPFAAGNGPSDRITRTMTHELAHCFNLIHTFDNAVGAGRASTSFMNYPSEFVGGPDAYWRQFGETRRFEESELRHLWHAHLQKVCMGGGPLTEGHLFRGDPTDLVPEAEYDGLRLELRHGGPRVRAAGDRWRYPDGLRRFGEPVRVEVKLANTSGRERPADDVLDPAHLRTAYLIRRPDGRVVRFRPVVSRCGEGRGRVLFPAAADGDRPQALYEGVQLSYGAGGFYFQEPGQYHVQALYPAGGGRWLASNVLRVWVGYPDRATERAVVPTLRADVAGYLAVWGARAHRAAGAVLRDFVEGETGRLTSGTRKRGKPRPRHPLVIEAVRCLAADLADPGAVPVIGPDGRRAIRVEPADPAAAAKLLADHYAVTPTADKPEVRKHLAASLAHLDNLTFGHTAGSWLRLLRGEDGQEAHLRNLLAHLIDNRFRKQGVPPSVRTRYNNRWLDPKPG